VIAGAGDAHPIRERSGRAQRPCADQPRYLTQFRARMICTARVSAQCGRSDDELERWGPGHETVPGYLAQRPFAQVPGAFRIAAVESQPAPAQEG
jgi:hypothetical protein